MKEPIIRIWIDQDLCTGCGLCEEASPDMFTLLEDGLAYVKEDDKIYAESKGNPEGSDGLAVVPYDLKDLIIEIVEDCPGECIFIEPGP